MVDQLVSEIEEQLGKAAFTDCVVQFNPHLAPVSRGISTTIVAKASATLEELYKTWSAAYAEQPFVNVLPSGTFPDTLKVVGTNRADISAVYDSRTHNFVITAVLDNLLKGASGQAVQILNLKYGFDETDSDHGDDAADDEAEYSEYGNTPEQSMSRVRVDSSIMPPVPAFVPAVLPVIFLRL